METMNRKGQCSVHEIITRHQEESFSKLAAEISEIRSDVKADMGSIREDIHTLADLMAGLGTLRVNQDNLGREIESVWRDVKEIKEKVTEVLLEKERWITAGKIDQERMKKDIEAAHVMIRAIQETRDTETREICAFMAEVKSGMRLSLLVAGALPSVCLFIYWLITKLYHLG